MVLDVRARLHSTSGGLSETELNELAVRPTSVPSGARAVTTVTPVAKLPSASRNSRCVKPGAKAREGGVGASMGRGSVRRKPILRETPPPFGAAG